MPARYRIDEHRIDGHAGELIVEWLEDVPTADVRWDHARFARAARLLGRLAVRLTRVAARLRVRCSRSRARCCACSSWSASRSCCPRWPGTPCGPTRRSPTSPTGTSDPTCSGSPRGSRRSSTPSTGCRRRSCTATPARRTCWCRRQNPDTFVAVDWSLSPTVRRGLRPGTAARRAGPRGVARRRGPARPGRDRSACVHGGPGRRGPAGGRRRGAHRPPRGPGGAQRVLGAAARSPRWSRAASD